VLKRASGDEDEGQEGEKQAQKRGKPRGGREGGMTMRAMRQSRRRTRDVQNLSFNGRVRCYINPIQSATVDGSHYLLFVYSY